MLGKDGKQQKRLTASTNTGNHLYHAIIFSQGQLLQVRISFNLHRIAPYLCASAHFLVMSFYHRALWILMFTPIFCVSARFYVLENTFVLTVQNRWL